MTRFCSILFRNLDLKMIVKNSLVGLAAQFFKSKNRSYIERNVLTAIEMHFCTTAIFGHHTHSIRRTHISTGPQSNSRATAEFMIKFQFFT